MENKKKSLFNVMQQNSAKKVKVCTNKFCVTGILVERYDEDNLVCLENVDLEYNDGKRTGEHKDNICICDDHIIAFEIIKENN